MGFLAFETVALLSRGVMQWGARDAGASSANVALGRFASTEVAYAPVYHRTGDCHATQFP
jgi:hypothetical protein